MVLNKLDTIGLRSSVKDSLLGASFRVRSISASSIEKTALFLPMLMIVLYLVKTWQSWMRSYLP